MFCGNCGAEVKESASFCPECGAAAKNTLPNRKGFAKMRAQAAADVYETEVLPYLAPSDGLIHAIMVTSFSKWLNQSFGVEKKYTVQLDEILTRMQQDGCEIVDVKITILQNQGLTGHMEGFHTIILYR